MKYLRNWLLAKPERAARNGLIWNLTASIINGLEAVVILAVAARTLEIEYSGIYTIGFTIANLFMCIGKYGVRNFQVTDVDERYSFHEYRLTRIISLCAMIFISVIYIFLQSYSLEKRMIILLFVFIYAIEAFEDVYLAALQHNGRLDSGTRMFSARWFITLFVWILLLVISKNALVSVMVAFVFDLSVAILLILSIRRDVNNRNTTFSLQNVKRILLSCLPLCVVAMLSIYLPNAAKYSIDYFLGDELQAYFGYVAMPVFVIDLLCFVLFQPLMVKMAEYWKNCKNTFLKYALYLCVVVLIISIVIYILAYYFGIPILSIIYSCDLTRFKKEFMILMISGSFLAYIGLFVSLLTIMRRQRIMMILYGFASILVFSLLQVFTEKYSLIGAAIINFGCIAILSVFLIIAFWTIALYEKKKEKIKTI